MKDKFWDWKVRGIITPVLIAEFAEGRFYNHMYEENDIDKRILVHIVPGLNDTNIAKEVSKKDIKMYYLNFINQSDESDENKKKLSNLLMLRSKLFFFDFFPSCYDSELRVQPKKAKTFKIVGYNPNSTKIDYPTIKFNFQLNASRPDGGYENNDFFKKVIETLDDMGCSIPGLALLNRWEGGLACPGALRKMDVDGEQARLCERRQIRALPSNYYSLRIRQGLWTIEELTNIGNAIIKMHDETN